MDSVFRMLWDGSVSDWPAEIIPAMEAVGINAKVLDANVKTNPAKFDEVLAENARAQTSCGHEGERRRCISTGTLPRAEPL